MDHRRRRTCRFCMKILYNSEFHIIGEVTKQMLDVLILELDLDKEEENVICNECADILQHAVDFKTTCLNKNQRVCRFCMKAIEGGSYTYLQDNKEHIFLVDMVQKHIPELHLHVTEEVVTCAVCLDSLQGLSSFIRNCLNAEEKFKENMKGTEVEFNDNQHFTLTSEVGCNDVNLVEKKYDRSEEGNTVNDKKESEDTMEMEYENINIKNEEPEIKSEENESLQDATSSSQSPLKILNDNERYTSQTSLNRHFTLYICEKCPYKTIYKQNLKKHTLVVHESSPNMKILRCEKCSYKTKHESYLKEHMLVHREVKIYSCEVCSYETKQKAYLEKHVQTHETSEFEGCTYENCLYKTKYKDQLNRHMLIHQSFVEVAVYKCKQCPFETQHKNSLKAHCITHQKPSEPTIYKCESCSFQTIHKTSLRKHNILHQNISYQCETCSYETKFKNNLKYHMRVHQDFSEVTVYQCQSCPFKTKYKINLQKHCLTHKDASEVTVYKCDMCCFSTKHDVSLKRHSLIHRDDSEVKIHLCDKCPYKTRRKYTLKMHMMIHEDN